MSVIASIVPSRKQKYRSFKSFLGEANSEYDDVVYHTDVKWLSRGKVLKPFIALKDKITKFLETEPQEFSELHNSSSNEDLIFLCDIISHLKDLRKKKIDFRSCFGKQIQSKVKTFQKSTFITVASNDICHDDYVWKICYDCKCTG